MTVALPNVTLVAIDGVAHELTRRALVDSLREITPAEVVVWSDKAILGTHIECERPTHEGALRILWYEVPYCVRTSHFLFIQWDSWVLNGSLWRPEWLVLDYLGAPWPWHKKGAQVGNGGFTLRSTRLARWVAEHEATYPFQHAEDTALCIAYRRQLENEGFVWGSLDQARAFSFERETPRESFGYHGVWHWPSVLCADALRERLVLANDYVCGKSEWREMQERLRLG